MPIIATEELTPQTRLTQGLNDQVYCGLDSCVTLEVFEELQTQGSEPDIYQFERALQAPYLDMMLRGFLVDEITRRKLAAELSVRQLQTQGALDEFARAVWDKGLNPRSPEQLKAFFYREMRIPEVWISQKGVRKVSTNREALEKVEEYLYARPFVSCILALRDIAKQLEVLTTKIDSDGRFRTSYNIAGTETGRPSSSKNAFGTGGNAQNITPSMRVGFVADAGYKLGVVDLEQVEARDVGFICGCLFDDWRFLDNCESGDLHTNNAKLVWPHLGWTGDKKADRAIADGNFYRDFSFRDMSKRGGHLTNYMGTAWTMARSLKIPIVVAEEFQARYCRGARGVEPAFPAIPRWWTWVAEQLQTTMQLTDLFGRKRTFFGRSWDDSTLREAIAYGPQGTTANRMNLGLYRVWKHMPQVQLLAQGFDSITFQFLEAEEALVIPEVLERVRVPITAPNGRVFVVPGEAKTGWNWGYFDPTKNPSGLRKWSPSGDPRKRATGLQRQG